MKKYLITNKEVYLVTYTVEGKDAADAIKRWRNDQGEEIDMQYLNDLNDYIKYSIPEVQEFITV